MTIAAVRSWSQSRSRFQRHSSHANLLSLLCSLCWLFVIAECSNEKQIIVLKCCPKGEGLNERHICEPAAAGATTTAEEWEPIVYSPAQKNLLPPLTVPENFTFSENTRPNCGNGGTITTYLDETSQIILIEDNGSLFVRYKHADVTVAAGNYCISPKGSLLCMDAEQQQQQQQQQQDHEQHQDKRVEKNVKKCCVMDALYSEVSASCVSRNDSNKKNFLSENTFIYSGFPSCKSREYAISGKLDEKFSLNVDGTLRTKAGHSLGNYCVEHILEQPNEKASIFTCASSLYPPLGDENGGSVNSNKFDDAASSSSNSTPQDFRYAIYPYALLLSVLFLIITLICSFLLPSSYHALHWKCQTHYIVCLIVGDLLLAITQIAGETLKHTFLCVLIATAMHFFFLSAFFWLNTMCFNIWWTFRDLRPTNLDKNQEICRLILYELYAWGVPLMIVIFGYIMDQVLTDEYPGVLRPRFGYRKCWFYGDKESFVYFFGPVGLLLFINLILFAATTRELTCGLWKREVVKSTTERIALSHICLKLVIVMGITWIADLLSWIIGGPDYMWYLTDLVNAFQGIFIFIVIGCQPQVLNAFKRICCFNESSSGNNLSSNAIILHEPSSAKPAVETVC